jgi:ATP-dependent DNA helicase RecG
MTESIDLRLLAERESEQVEWKENVADVNDVVKTLSAFANDLANLVGGYVICGAREDKDEHGFPRLVEVGLAANRLKEVEGEVLTRCRTLVSPAITPIVGELPGATPDRRILVFVQPATPHAHTFRGAEGGKHFVRISRETREARNGVLRDLLVRKAAVPPWDIRLCERATVADLYLLAIRDALTRMEMYSPERGDEAFLVPDVQLHALVPSLCVAEPLTGTVRPRNFALLLFGRQPQKFIPGAFSLFSIYPGTDRSEPHSERHEIGGTVLDQVRRLTVLLETQATTIFDKEDTANPNKVRYPVRALTEALGNTLAHRDYELYDPVRITAFIDRIEFVSPGTLPMGVDPVAFRQGRVGPRWRNQVLAWFFNRLGITQAEGQGLQTIFRIMAAAGCPPPELKPTRRRVRCTLGVNPTYLPVVPGA